MSDDAFTQTRRILRVLLDEHKAPPMALVALANLRRIEDHHRFLSQRIATLEAQREAVADVASEGDVEDLLDALDNLSADPKDGETWGARYQTAGALHAAWQDERQRRMQAEEDAERWHRLFDEGATLTAAKDAQLAAASDRYARAVAGADEVRGRLVAERAAALSVTTREGLSASEWVLRTGLAERDRDAALADVARLRADLERSEKRADEAAEEHNQLVEAIEERLPRYVFDDGTGDEASPVESVEYAGDEIGRLRADMARLKAELVEARGKALEEAAKVCERLAEFSIVTPPTFAAAVRALAAPAAKGGA